MFFTYTQNNSGGRFQGPATYVIVEAPNAEKADRVAEGLGLYFDGDGDCTCCGQRWYSAWGEGDEKPLIYGQDAISYAKKNTHTSLSKGRCDLLLIQYADGTKKIVK